KTRVIQLCLFVPSAADKYDNAGDYAPSGISPPLPVFLTVSCRNRAAAEPLELTAQLPYQPELSAFLMLVLPLLDGRHGVIDVLVWAHGGIGVNDFPRGGDYVGGPVGVLRVAFEHRVVSLHDAAVRIRGDGELVAAFAHRELVQLLDRIV